MTGIIVALRKESVDRNCNAEKMNMQNRLSLSARRAWIEMLESITAQVWRPVALRKESVDRNNYYTTQYVNGIMSLSARRAWIEIIKYRTMVVLCVTSLSARRAWIEIGAQTSRYGSHCVALRKESVDRNHGLSKNSAKSSCRSPQGERG